MSVANLIGQLKESKEVFDKALMLLQQDGKWYLTKE
jgi:hypothetical protein